MATDIMATSTTKLTRPIRSIRSIRSVCSCFIKQYFENPMFRSDGLKLYPTLVIRGTGLYELWKTGRYVNYTPEELVEVSERSERAL